MNDADNKRFGSIQKYGDAIGRFHTQNQSRLICNHCISILYDIMTQKIDTAPLISLCHTNYVIAMNLPTKDKRRQVFTHCRCD